jgi:phosphoribosylanthranilate isomerase
MKARNDEDRPAGEDAPGQKQQSSHHSPQVKICGLTRVDEAVACAELGANAIGCVFYPPSPRNLTDDRAREISLALPPTVCSVGVFVDEDFAGIMKRVEVCRLGAVQLHGREPAELASRLAREGIVVIKSLFVNGSPALSEAAFYGASGYLIECAGGLLPGGNAKAWNWENACSLSKEYPVVLAGGLTPENVTRAIGCAMPDAVDVSSGVELSPGRKDVKKVERFLEAVARCNLSKPPRIIFSQTARRL